MRHYLLALLLPFLAPLGAVAEPVVADSGKPEVSRLLHRQQELAQRLAGIYLMRGAPELSIAGRNELGRTRDAMSANMAALHLAMADDPAAHETLERLDMQMNWLSAAVDGDGALEFPLVVADAASRMDSESRRLAERQQARQGG